MKKTHRFEVFRDKRKHFRWRLTRIRGGKIIAESGEGYQRRGDLHRQINAMLDLKFESCDFTETR